MARIPARGVIAGRVDDRPERVVILTAVSICPRSVRAQNRRNRNLSFVNNHDTFRPIVDATAITPRAGIRAMNCAIRTSIRRDSRRSRRLRHRNGGGRVAADFFRRLV